MGADQLLAVAAGEIGYTEQPRGSNRTKFGAWYGLDGQPWCAMFISWCADKAGVATIVPKFAYTPAGAEWFQTRGSWSSLPQRGDLAFYDLGGLGRISHVGLVESIPAAGGWYSIEGNTSGQGGRSGGEVRRQHRHNLGTSRGGFGRPNWAGMAPAVGAGYPGAAVRISSVGAAVTAIQGALNRFLTLLGRSQIKVDGHFGPVTLTAVLDFQRARQLLADGVVGPVTWSALAP